jgi:hypothetical protein
MTHGHTYRPPRRYGLTLGQIEDIAAICKKIDEICDKPAAKDETARVHEILASALGTDSGLLYLEHD